MPYLPLIYVPPPVALLVKESLICLVSLCLPQSATWQETPHPSHPPGPWAHTHPTFHKPGHQQLLCAVLTKFSWPLKDLIAILVCSNTLTHLDQRLPTGRFLAWLVGFPASIYRHSWGKSLSPEVCMDYRIRRNYRTKETFSSLVLDSGPKSKSLLCLLKCAYICLLVCRGFQEFITLHVS